MKPLCVMLVAAEASGDALGAGLAKALRARLGESGVRFVGVGGSRMRAEGIESPFDISELSILGWLDGLRAYPRVVRKVRETLQLALQERPDVVVLIDSWGFTLRVAQAVRAALPEVALIKYVGPQVWASRPGRARTLAKSVDHLMALHAFDPPWFEGEGLETTFVGNPALATDFSEASGSKFRQTLGALPEDDVLLVLPGSRPKEIARLTPVFQAAVDIVRMARPRVKVAFVVADTVAQMLKDRLAGWSTPVHLIEGEPAKSDAMRGATLALACSGTVSTELALAGCPMVIAYRIDNLTYAVGRRLMTTPYVTLMNIAAGREVVPEFLQGDCTAPNLAEALIERLENSELRRAQVGEQSDALAKMGVHAGNPADNAAQAILGVLERRGRSLGGH